MSAVVQANFKLSEELKQCCSVELSQQRVKLLVECLEEQHRKLIQAQLATLTRELMFQAEAVSVNGHMGAVEHSASLDNAAVKEHDGINIVEVQVDCKTESLILPDCVGLQSGQEELVTELDDVEPAPVIVQTTIAPLQIKEEALMSRKRRPKDEPGGEQDGKLQRIS